MGCQARSVAGVAVSDLFPTHGYRLAFLPLDDDGASDFEFLTRHVPYAEYALRAFPESGPSVWRFDGDCWESEEKYTRNGHEGRYSVMWWDI